MKILIYIILICMIGRVSAYVPVKYINGGSMKCMDNATECSKEGYFYNKNNKTVSFLENKNTFTYFMMGALCVLGIAVIYKAGGGGKRCIIAS